AARGPFALTGDHHVFAPHIARHIPAQPRRTAPAHLGNLGQLAGAAGAGPDRRTGPGVGPPARPDGRRPNGSTPVGGGGGAGAREASGMTLPAVLSPEAEADLDDAAGWHERECAGRGAELGGEVGTA